MGSERWAANPRFVPFVPSCPSCESAALPGRPAPKLYAPRMQRTGFLAILNTALLVLILIAVGLAMVMFDRQHDTLRAIDANLTPAVRRDRAARRRPAGPAGRRRRGSGLRWRRHRFLRRHLQPRPVRPATGRTTPRATGRCPRSASRSASSRRVVQTDGYQSRVEELVLESLLTRDPETLAFGPLLAESWEVSEDGLTIAYDLRDDVRFSDGSPMTSEDVVFTMNLIKDPKTNNPNLKSYYEVVESGRGRRAPPRGVHAQRAVLPVAGDHRRPGRSLEELVRALRRRGVQQRAGAALRLRALPARRATPRTGNPARRSSWSATRTTGALPPHARPDRLAGHQRGRRRAGGVPQRRDRLLRDPARAARPPARRPRAQREGAVPGGHRRLQRVQLHRLEPEPRRRAHPLRRPPRPPGDDDAARPPGDGQPAHGRHGRRGHRPLQRGHRPSGPIDRAAALRPRRRGGLARRGRLQGPATATACSRIPPACRSASHSSTAPAATPARRRPATSKTPWPGRASRRTSSRWSSTQ